MNTVLLLLLRRPFALLRHRLFCLFCTLLLLLRCPQPDLQPTPLAAPQAHRARLPHPRNVAQRDPHLPPRERGEPQLGRGDRHGSDSARVLRGEGTDAFGRGDGRENRFAAEEAAGVLRERPAAVDEPFPVWSPRVSCEGCGCAGELGAERGAHRREREGVRVLCFPLRVLRHRDERLAPRCTLPDQAIRVLRIRRHVAERGRHARLRLGRHGADEGDEEEEDEADEEVDELGDVSRGGEEREQEEAEDDARVDSRRRRVAPEEHATAQSVVHHRHHDGEKAHFLILSCRSAISPSATMTAFLQSSSRFFSLSSAFLRLSSIFTCFLRALSASFSLLLSSSSASFCVLVSPAWASLRALSASFSAAFCALSSLSASFFRSTAACAASFSARLRSFSASLPSSELAVPAVEAEGAVVLMLVLVLVLVLVLLWRLSTLMLGEMMLGVLVAAVSVSSSTTRSESVSRVRTDPCAPSSSSGTPARASPSPAISRSTSLSTPSSSRSTFSATFLPRLLSLHRRHATSHPSSSVTARTPPASPSPSPRPPSPPPPAHAARPSPPAPW
ncbi:hypothetical protein CALCODRAFT_181511 [Calocera cornea HHB12733]|uniref:Uncharacterized protein n=1 Tax=Calocera cornea HHB12733 TaxID=1353952 RepID=A0A165HRW6_9BASI|nr:hypothetical protein CALCODRAFT_181511 [Calocera cornea HHB12733]